MILRMCRRNRANCPDPLWYALDPLGGRSVQPEGAATDKKTLGCNWFVRVRRADRRQDFPEDTLGAKRSGGVERGESGKEHGSGGRAVGHDSDVQMY